jgi:hypothetical protein
MGLPEYITLSMTTDTDATNWSVAYSSNAGNLTLEQKRAFYALTSGAARNYGQRPFAYLPGGVDD